MKFIVEKEIFEKLPNACFGVVMAKGIDNRKAYPEIDRLLDESITAAAQRFEGKKVKEEPDIQCKYWSAKKQVHEKHINQLYGTMVSYCIEHQVAKEKAMAILITNIKLSPMAKKMASYLGVIYVENYESGDYPCIKCNIGHGKDGEATKIYHLPFDQQYDSTKIRNKGEFYAFTVAEAEAAGFRRAFKWFGAD